MHVYRNRNTGDEVESAEPRPRLEHLSNWDRIAGPDPDTEHDQRDVPDFDPAEHTAPDVIAYIEQADRDEALRVLDLEAANGGKQRSTVLALREAVEVRDPA